MGHRRRQPAAADANTVPWHFFKRYVADRAQAAEARGDGEAAARVRSVLATIESLDGTAAFAADAWRAGWLDGVTRAELAAAFQQVSARTIRRHIEHLEAKGRVRILEQGTGGRPTRYAPGAAVELASSSPTPSSGR